MNTSSKRVRYDKRESTTTIKNVIVLVFTLFCFTLAGYMSFLQFQSYLRNEDSTAISHEHFDGENDLA